MRLNVSETDGSKTLQHKERQSADARGGAPVRRGGVALLVCARVGDHRRGHAGHAVRAAADLVHRYHPLAVRVRGVEAPGLVREARVRDGGLGGRVRLGGGRGGMLWGRGLGWGGVVGVCADLARAGADPR